MVAVIKGSSYTVLASSKSCTAPVRAHSPPFFFVCTQAPCTSTSLCLGRPQTRTQQSTTHSGPARPPADQAQLYQGRGNRQL